MKCDSPYSLPNPKLKAFRDAGLHVYAQKLLDAGKLTESIGVPCGKCPNCKKRRINQWAFRMFEEGKRSKTMYFVTLTYAPRFLPHTPNGLATLRRADLVAYWKNLRTYQKKRSTDKIRYFVAGEYGSNFGRPHYHAIVFNANPTDLVAAWQGRGDVDLSEPGMGALKYVIKYIDKSGRIPMFAKDDRLPEFHNMSKGLGRGYLTGEKVAFHKADPATRNFVMDYDGHKIAMPKYYFDNIFDDDDKLKIYSAAENAEAEQLENLRSSYDEIYGDNFPKFDFSMFVEDLRLQRWHNYHYQREKKRKDV